MRTWREQKHCPIWYRRTRSCRRSPPSVTTPWRLWLSTSATQTSSSLTHARHRKRYSFGFTSATQTSSSLTPNRHKKGVSSGQPLRDTADYDLQQTWQTMTYNRQHAMQFWFTPAMQTLNSLTCGTYKKWYSCSGHPATLTFSSLTCNKYRKVYSFSGHFLHLSLNVYLCASYVLIFMLFLINISMSWQYMDVCRRWTGAMLWRWLHSRHLLPSEPMMRKSEKRLSPLTLSLSIFVSVRICFCLSLCASLLLSIAVIYFCVPLSRLEDCEFLLWCAWHNLQSLF